MSSLLDMVGAAILFGVLLLAVGRMQGNINSTLYQNTFSITTQTEAVNYALQMEYEVEKIGYGVTGTKIAKADTASLAFLGAMSYGGAVDSISYSTGIMDTSTTNPNDFKFIRYSRSAGKSLTMRLGMTYFRLAYFDSTNTQLSTPVTGASLNAIRAIDVKMRLESTDPVVDASTGLSSYNAVTWEKLIYPRNLGKPF